MMYYNKNMKNNIRFGYSFWGYLGDTKYDKDGALASTPDGNATYSYAILYEAQKRGWTTYLMQEDRDWPGYRKEGNELFNTFYKKERVAAYMNSIVSYENGDEELPDLDVLLLEWRWPIPGRNCEVSKDSPLYQTDLDRQTQLLNHYKNKGTKIIIFDLDHKLSYEDETKWEPNAIFEFSTSPKFQKIQRTQVCVPCLSKFVYDEKDFEIKTILPSFNKVLAYVGSRYERDDVIDEYIKPISDRHQKSVKFYGNWFKTINECLERWPNISFENRVDIKQFEQAYSDAVACPLLAKREYFKTGFLTARPWEALFFGTIPVGFTENNGIHQYITSRYIADDAKMLEHIIVELSYMTLKQRSQTRINCFNKWVERCGANIFIDKIEDVLNGSSR